MKKLLPLLFVLTLFGVVNAQKIIPSESVISDISEQGGKLNIKIELGASDQNSPNAKILGSEIKLGGCKFNVPGASSIKGDLDNSSDDSKTRICSFPLNQKTTSAFYEFILVFQTVEGGTFVNKPEVSLGRIYKSRNQETIIVNLTGESVWFGDNLITVPIKVDKDVLLEVSLWEIDDNNVRTTEVANGTKLLQSQDKNITLKISGTRNVEVDRDYGIFVKRADRYAGYFDITFKQTPSIDAENANKATKTWKGLKSDKLDITNIEVTDINQATRVVVINDIKDINFKFKTSVRSGGVFELDGKSVKGTETDEHTYTIKDSELVALEKAGQFHSLKFTASRSGHTPISREIALVIDTKPNFLGNKVTVEKDPTTKIEYLVIEYNMSRPTKHRLRLDGKEASGKENRGLDSTSEVFTCTKIENRICTYIQKFEINSFKSKLQNNKFGAFVIERGEGVADADKDIAKINFEITTGLSPEKLEQMKKIEGQLVNNKISDLEAKKAIASILEIPFSDSAATTPQTDEEKSINYIVERIKKGDGKGGVAMNILKLAGKVFAAYFGLKF